MSATSIAWMEALLMGILVGCIVVTVMARHEASRLLDGPPPALREEAATRRRILESTICVAASLVVTTGLLGLTLFLTALRETVSIVLLNMLGLTAGAVAWQSAERIDALPAAPRALLGGLLATLIWLSAVLMIVVVLSN